MMAEEGSPTLSKRLVLRLESCKWTWVNTYRPTGSQFILETKKRVSEVHFPRYRQLRVLRTKEMREIRV